ncbi:MAG: adenosylcobinamide-GDP ribazoletransferase, partial [Bacteroidales bacterium]|nr:adenosylcobinamide-GDP ribazoletransferase [Bacteroidales bacterium]
SKSKPVGEKHTVLTLIIAMVFGVAPLFLLNVMIVPAIIIFNTLVFLYFRYYVKKKIGGYTGDVLGALQQLSELGVYLTIIIVNVLML